MLHYVALCCPMLPYVALSCLTLPYVTLKLAYIAPRLELEFRWGVVVGWWWCKPIIVSNPTFVELC